MRITTQIADVETLLSLTDRFDAHETAAFRAATEAVLAARPAVLRLDLSGVRFLDSTALAELLRLRTAVEGSGGSLVLAPISDPVRVILELTGLAGVLLDPGLTP